jgi:hypothetical protein
MIMDFIPGSEAFLATDFAGTSLHRGQCVVIIACRENTVLAEVLDSQPGERIVSIPKSMLIPKMVDNEDIDEG